ncbi:BTAD domain-containing putative transcriptional regulator [Aeromicrobium ginsengisoli]|uniref:Bacterial transcriptional activator domain-containing protein n=1 Tax=Aeromicrobium ginsengisoli TaxID=363867 RepID=A0A5M4FCQ3_9ACTN|nr:BTAD domain-containing putative transcriptional regulator [Aeromicrobium ginsengisoli]KAA1397115.1 hypothetical protein ESP70_006815 [Aeromicrobium ginsengisoli]
MFPPLSGADRGTLDVGLAIGNPEHADSPAKRVEIEFLEHGLLNIPISGLFALTMSGCPHDLADESMSDQRRVIQSKIRVPKARGSSRSRHRLNALIVARLEQYGILWIVATAGAGKTTAVVHALANSPIPTAWLRADDGDVAPGRFLVYLEHAIGQALPEKSPLVSQVLARDVAHPEVASLLAESLDGSPLTVVIDEVERLESSPSALATLSAFLTHVPAHARVILVSRRPVRLDLARAEVDETLGFIEESDLAFTVAEAQKALEDLARPNADAAQAVQATGGWVTGVLFDSWRSAAHVHGSGGEADPLRSYLSSEIMGTLDPELQTFLVKTSILDLVTPERASRLGFIRAGELLGRLEQAHLPVEFDGPYNMRCHARFREFLNERWRELDSIEQKRLRVQHGELLVAEDRLEDAVDEYILAGRHEAAEDVATEVILDVAARLDIEVVDRWLSSFSRSRIENSVALTAAEMLAAIDREEFGRGAAAADRLIDLTQQADTIALDSRLIAAMAWCYFIVCRIEDAFQVLDLIESDQRIEAMRFCIGVELSNDSTHYRDRPRDTDTEIDGLLARVDLAHGRFSELAEREDVSHGAIRLSRVGALSNLGRLEEAQAGAAAPYAGWTGVRIRAELLADCGLPQEAWSELISGRERLVRSESPLYRIFSLLTEAMLALRFHRDVPQAQAALRTAAKEPTAQQRVRVLEQLALWSGLIGLYENDDIKATQHLRDAVAIMTEWDRRLLLPTAAVYLAEAEWRIGEESRSDAATDLALETAVNTGSMFVLGRALAEFPAVLSRRLDLEDDPDGPWHDIGRSMIVNSDSLTTFQPVGEVFVEELSRCALVISGRRHEPRLLKSVELMAYLAAAGGSAHRSDLTAALFPSKNDKSASSYLRMAANGVRDLMKDPECITLEPARVVWNRGSLSSTYVEATTSYKRLRTVTGQQRLELAMKVLQDVDGKEVLPGTRSPWVTDHRERWAALVLDIRHAAAEAAFDTADYGVAHRFVRQVLAADPYRERAWRLAMKVADAVGDTDRVIGSYRSCELALKELSTSPSEATRKLFATLHR